MPAMRFIAFSEKCIAGMARSYSRSHRNNHPQVRVGMTYLKTRIPINSREASP